ncbi:MAG: sigma factor-like helix-turn-helix DNA-binding protein [Muricomes sp.]
MCGKVVGSSRDFPYTEVRTSVQMYDPKEQDKVNEEIRKKQAERLLLLQKIEEAEHYISGIQDSEIREIFELLFLQGLTQEKVAEIVGYTQGRISQIIGRYLKD